MRFIFAGMVIGIYSSMPAFAQAQGLVSSCEGATCSACDIVSLANTVIQWLIGITFLFFAIIAVYHGIKMVTSGGNPGAKNAAKSGFTNAFIGLFIILAAWLIVDTLVRGVVRGTDGQIDGYGPWAKVQCARQTATGITEITINESEFTNYYVPEYAMSAGTGSGGGGGSCSVITDTNNVCHPTNLTRFFGARASEASQICHKESGGRVINSRTDICCGTNGCQSGDPSFSGGVFQINVLANHSLIPGCSGNFFRKNGNNTPQGNCVQRNSRGICTGWSCEITNQSMYNTCMVATNNINFNLTVAGNLFRQSGGFRPWNWSRRLCNIP